MEMGNNLPSRPKVLALDLDGTVLHDRFPEFGKPIEGMLDQLHALRAIGWKIAIWTCRTDTAKIKAALELHGVPFDFINENPLYDTGSRKIHADVYLDDKALNFDGNVSGLAAKLNDFKPWHRVKGVKP
jgi:hydroxymethylpyrimidine pyrophosphatase-like HAD family hydrolase